VAGQQGLPGVSCCRASCSLTCCASKQTHTAATAQQHPYLHMRNLRQRWLQFVLHTPRISHSSTICLTPRAVRISCHSECLFDLHIMHVMLHLIYTACVRWQKGAGGAWSASELGKTTHQLLLLLLLLLPVQ
jgi:hypothetical protein